MLKAKKVKTEDVVRIHNGFNVILMAEAPATKTSEGNLLPLKTSFTIAGSLRSMKDIVKDYQEHRNKAIERANGDPSKFAELLKEIKSEEQEIKLPEKNLSIADFEGFKLPTSVLSENLYDIVEL